MNIVINGKHVELTEALTSYVREKFSKLTNYFEHIIEIDVTLSVEQTKNKEDRQTVEVTIWANGAVLRACESSFDMYASVDLVLDKLERQIVKYKEKLKDIPRRTAHQKREREATHTVLSLSEKTSEANEPKIIRTKKFALKPMFADEAAMQLDLLGQDFVVFSNAQTNEVNVVYRRNDGNIGLIEPHF